MKHKINLFIKSHRLLIAIIVIGGSYEVCHLCRIGLADHGIEVFLCPVIETMLERFTEDV